MAAVAGRVCYGVSPRAAASVTGRRMMGGEALLKTPLHELHVGLGAKMVPFSGYDMPVQYKAGLMKEHNHCRSEASLFDVAHMGPTRIAGKDRVAFMETVTVCDVQALPENSGGLSLITNDHGGIIDDCIVTKLPDSLFVVLNAGCKEKDLAHMATKLDEFKAADPSRDVRIEPLNDLALVALQGPAAAAVLAPMVNVDLTSLKFLSVCMAKINGAECLISRSGYTGEDGFEIAAPASAVCDIWTALSADSRVAPAGLGARDSLRLEAGLCLYGNDIDHTTTPAEAGLMWTISKRRRAEGGFPGYDVVAQQMKEGIMRKRVGLTLKGAPARSHTPVCDDSGTKVGEITSGCPSPTLKHPVAMAYVPKSMSKSGTVVKVELRGKMVDATVSKMPFVPANYYRG